MDIASVRIYVALFLLFEDYNKKPRLAVTRELIEVSNLFLVHDLSNILKYTKSSRVTFLPLHFTDRDYEYFRIMQNYIITTQIFYEIIQKMDLQSHIIVKPLNYGQHMQVLGTIWEHL
jgi:hypothetical protein